MIGSYSDPTVMDQWYREALPVAREDLASNPTLFSLLDGFKGYEAKKYKESRNFVLLNCLPTVKGERVKQQLEEIAYYERALTSFDVLHWSAAKLREFKSKIQSDKFDDGLTVFTELLVAQRLVDAFARSQVNIYPRLSSGKIADSLVDNGTEKVYVEVGNLSDSLPEIIIERILDAAAEYLGPRITGNRYFEVEIETANLVFDQEGHIDEASSIAKLRQEIDDLALVQLSAQNGLIDVKEAAEVSKSLEAYEISRAFMPGHLGEMVDSFKSGPLKTWAQTANLTRVDDKMLVQSVISWPLKSPLVEVHTKGFYPSKSAEAEMTSFANHVVRHVKQQIESDQIEPGKANVILVQGYNWMIRMLSVKEAVRQVVEAISGFLKSSILPDLYGVGFFSRYPEDGYFVLNPNFKGSSSLAVSLVNSLKMTI